jgi:uncharacterized membrane protein
MLNTIKSYFVAIIASIEQIVKTILGAIVRHSLGIFETSMNTVKVSLSDVKTISALILIALVVVDLFTGLKFGFVTETLSVFKQILSLITSNIAASVVILVALIYIKK